MLCASVMILSKLWVLILVVNLKHHLDLCKKVLAFFNLIPADLFDLINVVIYQVFAFSLVIWV